LRGRCQLWSATVNEDARSSAVLFGPTIVTHQALREITLSLFRSLLSTIKSIRLVGVTVSIFEIAISAVALPQFEDLTVLPAYVGQRQASDQLEREESDLSGNARCAFPGEP